MKIYLAHGLALVVVTLAWLLAVSAVLALSILMWLELIKDYVNTSSLVYVALFLPGVMVHIITSVTILGTYGLWRDFLKDWICAVKEDMSSARQAKLRDRIRGMKVVYRKYPIYPELRIYQELKKY